MAELTIQQAFELAMQHFRSGRFAEAEGVFRQIVQYQPQSADAWHMVGVIEIQSKRPAEGAQSISRAVALRPDAAHFHSNLGLALTQAGRFAEAVNTLEEAVRLSPNLADAHNNLGNALLRQGQLERATAEFRTAIELNPNLAVAHSNLAGSLCRQDDLEQAGVEYRLAIALQPNLGDAFSGLSSVLTMQNKKDGAAEMLQAAMRLNPGRPEHYHNLGNLFRDLGKTDAAIAQYRQAVALEPNLDSSYFSMGKALKDLGRFSEAVFAYRRAVEIAPDRPDYRNSLGTTLWTIGQIDEAIEQLRAAISIKNDEGTFYTNLGSALWMAGDITGAIVAHRKAVELAPDNPIFRSSLIHTLLFDPDASQSDIHQAEAEWNTQHALPLRSAIASCSNSTDPERRLRIGYVSADLREHSVAFTLLPLFANHDREKFEITCYANQRLPDEFTDRFKSHVDRWRDIFGMPDDKAAELITNDQIDILVDLSLHTAGNRLLVFARKPAPVQMTWMGYPASTGLDAMDYRLSDQWLDPPDVDEANYSEELIRLRDSFWCYDPMIAVSGALEPPASTNGFITFGCLNNPAKLNERVLYQWAQILKAVPHSQLLVMASPGSARERIIAAIATRQIDPMRITFVDRAERVPYLETYNRIDLILDTFPYNGHTTALDALWMGVPIVTFAGQTTCSRGGISLLNNVGLGEFVGKTPEQYVEIAVELAQNLPRLAELRRSIRRQMQRSPLMDAPRFARSIEQAYRDGWRRWCSSTSK